MAEIDEMQSRHISYWRKLNKKLRGKPYPVITIQRRTLSTASEILDTICDIPFEGRTEEKKKNTSHGRSENQFQ